MHHRCECVSLPCFSFLVGCAVNISHEHALTIEPSLSLLSFVFFVFAPVVTLIHWHSLVLLSLISNYFSNMKYPLMEYSMTGLFLLAEVEYVNIDVF
jgi:hypothetical protein